MAFPPPPTASQQQHLNQLMPLLWHRHPSDPTKSIGFAMEGRGSACPRRTELPGGRAGVPLADIFNICLQPNIVELLVEDPWIHQRHQGIILRLFLQLVQQCCPNIMRVTIRSKWASQLTVDTEVLSVYGSGQYRFIGDDFFHARTIKFSEGTVWNIMVDLDHGLDIYCANDVKDAEMNKGCGCAAEVAQTLPDPGTMGGEDDSSAGERRHGSKKHSKSARKDERERSSTQRYDRNAESSPARKRHRDDRSRERSSNNCSQPNNRSANGSERNRREHESSRHTDRNRQEGRRESPLDQAEEIDPAPRNGEGKEAIERTRYGGGTQDLP